jgi:DNA-directed DNA polymerase III PolC
MFIHLNCHSHYSLLTGANGVEELVQTASSLGMSALALTDINGLYGALPFYRAAKKVGIQPILGVEIKIQSQKRAVLLAKNMKGFGEICKIISDFHLSEKFSFVKKLSECSENVIVLVSDTETLQSLITNRGSKNICAELIAFDKNQSVRVLDFSRRASIPCVASNRVFFANKHDWEIHRLLTAINANTTIHSLPKNSLVSPEAWLKPTKEMVRLCREYPQALRNTLAVAEQCQVNLPIGEMQFPPFKTPNGESHQFYLERLARKQIAYLYNPITSEIQKRLEHELQIIERLHFAPYFLIVWDIIQEANRRGILAVGRGSAANSIVCRALGITEVDPIAHNLYFERFLNPERSGYPDIDIDFPWNRRDEILNYVFECYGSENVALISSHVRFRGRSVLREVGKALGIPVSEIEIVTSKLPHYSELTDLEKIRRNVPECRNLPLEDEPYRSMISLGQRIDGFPRHISIHCGGIVVSPRPITDFVPLQKTPKGFVVTQYDMYPIEDMGLLKIDILGQKGLAVQADVVRSVQTNYNTKINFTLIDPTRDKDTKALMRNGKTIGCFYVESPGMRNLLQTLVSDDFETLVAASSIIRPGVSNSGMMRAFIKRYLRKEPARYLHPKLESILKNTYGIMIYQEDAMQVAHAIAGMTLGEADNLRKCMSKKRDWERIETYKERFISGALNQNIDLSIAKEIWRQMESFAGYAFCKAHSASFALVSYRAAYLKTHYPAEFMAAVLSNQGGFYGTSEYIEEARRLGIKILPPDINQSSFEFTACNPNLNKNPAHNGAIRIGFMQIKKLTQKTIDRILKNRSSSFYASLEDFLQRTLTKSGETASLIRCGAFDSLVSSRPELLWRLEIFEKEQKTLSTKPNQQPLLFSPNFDMHYVVTTPQCSQYNSTEKTWAELECLDVDVSSHPISLYGINFEPENKDMLRKICKGHLPIPAKDLRRFENRVVTLVGWAIHHKHARTAKNKAMKFMTLEDSTASFEVTFFPKVYRKYGETLHDQGPYVIKGKIERSGYLYSVIALWVSRIKEP